MMTKVKEKIEELKAKGKEIDYKAIFKEVGDGWKDTEEMERWKEMQDNDEDRFNDEIEEFMERKFSIPSLAQFCLF